MQDKRAVGPGIEDLATQQRRPTIVCPVLLELVKSVPRIVAKSPSAAEVRVPALPAFQSFKRRVDERVTGVQRVSLGRETHQMQVRHFSLVVGDL